MENKIGSYDELHRFHDKNDSRRKSFYLLTYYDQHEPFRNSKQIIPLDMDRHISIQKAGKDGQRLICRLSIRGAQALKRDRRQRPSSQLGTFLRRFNQGLRPAGRPTRAALCTITPCAEPEADSEAEVRGKTDTTDRLVSTQCRRRVK